MAVVLTKNDFTINCVFTMRYADLPGALAAALVHVPTTAQVEHDLQAYSAAGCPVPHTERAVLAVCKWGGRIGLFVAARVLAGNTRPGISQHLESGIRSADPVDAIKHVTCVFGLGISFGSKHLRMMSPDKRVVLDGVLSKNLKFPCCAAGYAEICEDFMAISHHVTALSIINPMNAHYITLGIPNPRPTPHTWWPADIEMACFSRIRGWGGYAAGRRGQVAIDVPSPLAGGSAREEAPRLDDERGPSADRGCQINLRISKGKSKGLQKVPVYLKKGPKNFTKIVECCNSHWNIGMICSAHGHLWLKKSGTRGRCLIDEIAAAGGDFRGESGYVALTSGTEPCVGGSGYGGSIRFDAIKEAIDYLEQYFVVDWC